MPNSSFSSSRRHSYNGGMVRVGSFSMVQPTVFNQNQMQLSPLSILNNSGGSLSQPPSPQPSPQLSHVYPSKNFSFAFPETYGHLDNSKTLDRKYSTNSIFSIPEMFQAANQWQQVLNAASSKVNPQSEIPVSFTLKPEPVFTVCPPAADRIKGRVYVVRGALKKWDGKRFARCCRDSMCTKLAQGPTEFCKAHGGGTRCSTQGCKKAARGGSEHCAMHGGGKRCSHEGCTKAAVGNNLCRRHTRLLEEEKVSEEANKRVKTE